MRGDLEIMMLHLMLTRATFSFGFRRDEQAVVPTSHPASIRRDLELVIVRHRLDEINVYIRRYQPI